MRKHKPLHPYLRQGKQHSPRGYVGLWSGGACKKTGTESEQMIERTRWRDAVTGEYVDSAYAEANRATTVQEVRHELEDWEEELLAGGKPSEWRKEANRLLGDIEAASEIKPIGGSNNTQQMTLDSYTVALVIHCQVLKRP